MSRNLDHEYELLKKQYHEQKLLTADEYLRAIRELAEAYQVELENANLLPLQMEVKPIA